MCVYICKLMYVYKYMEIDIYHTHVCVNFILLCLICVGVCVYMCIFCTQQNAHLYIHIILLHMDIM